MIDWPKFLDDNHIAYRREGAEQLVTHCPMCGTGDKSEHLSINIHGRGWKCWRKPREHVGRSPVRLIMVLLGCNEQRARELAGFKQTIPDDFLSRIKSSLTTTTSQPQPSLTMPPEFHPIDQRASSRQYRNYLSRRGFIGDNLDFVCKQFNLHYCQHGPYRGRIIIPIYLRGNLVAWTSRTVFKSDKLRYKAEKLGQYILAEDALRTTTADTICMVEGPFDAMKVWTLGRNHGIVATCFFTAAATDAQIRRLRDILPRFKRRYYLLDRGTLATVLYMNWQTTLKAPICLLPDHIKDPGDINDSATLLTVLADRCLTVSRNTTI